MDRNKHRDIKSLFEAGMIEVKPDVLLNEKISLKNNTLSVRDISGQTYRYDISKYKNIIVTGAGKASASMARKIEQILGERISGGLVVTKYGFAVNTRKIKILEAAHPVPDENGESAALKIAEICKNAQKDDLIINLLSGGASALLPMPVDGISLENKKILSSALLSSGASIDEINIIRRHISKLKGGGLLNFIYPADLLTLIISDVIGDKKDIIGSGITFPAKRDINIFLDIMNKYGLINSFTKVIEAAKKQNRKYQYIQVDKTDQYRRSNFIIGNNETSLRKIEKEALKMGYVVNVEKSNIQGEAADAGIRLAEFAIDFQKNKAVKDRKYCFVFGGETTVTLKGNGRGGRNQEMALAAAIKLRSTNGIKFLSGGTDGNDGPTDAAGAVCDGSTLIRAEKMGLNAMDYLKNNDSYSFFNKLEDLIITGPSLTNVMDVQIILIENNQGDINS